MKEATLTLPLGNGIFKNYHDNNNLIEAYNFVIDVNGGLICYDTLDREVKFIGDNTAVFDTAYGEVEIKKHKIVFDGIEYDADMSAIMYPTDLISFFCIAGYPSYALNDKGLVTTALPQCRSFASYKGQLLAGGLLDAETKGIVAWSKIGTIDFTIDGTNTAGVIDLAPIAGRVEKIGTLGNSVIAYCENGIVVLKPSGNGFGVDYVMYYNGVKTGNHVCCTDEAHLFVLDNKYAHIIKNNPIKGIEILPLGNMYFGDGVKRVHFDARNKLFCIERDRITFLVDLQGRLTATNLVSAIGSITNSTIYLHNDCQIDRAFKDSSFLVSFGDFGIRANKTLTMVQTIGGEIDIPTVSYVTCLDERLNQHKVDYKITKQGVAYIAIYGVSFCNYMRFNSHKKINIQALAVSIKQTDKRSIRGSYAPTNNTGSTG